MKDEKINQVKHVKFSEPYEEEHGYSKGGGEVEEPLMLESGGVSSYWNNGITTAKSRNTYINRFQSNT